MKKIVLGISGGCSFLIFLILLFITSHFCHSQLSQQAAERWGNPENTAQISCFFSVNARISKDTILEFEHTIDGALVDASVVQESENEGEIGRAHV